MHPGKVEPLRSAHLLNRRAADGGRPVQADVAQLQVQSCALEEGARLVDLDAVQLYAMAAGHAWREQCMQQRPVSRHVQDVISTCCLLNSLLEDFRGGKDASDITAHRPANTFRCLRPRPGSGFCC